MTCSTVGSPNGSSGNAKLAQPASTPCAVLSLPRRRSFVPDSGTGKPGMPGQPLPARKTSISALPVQVPLGRTATLGRGALTSLHKIQSPPMKNLSDSLAGTGPGVIMRPIRQTARAGGLRWLRGLARFLLYRVEQKPPAHRGRRAWSRRGSRPLASSLARRTTQIPGRLHRLKNSFHFELNFYRGFPYCQEVALPSKLPLISAGSVEPGVIYGEGRDAEMVAFEESVVDFFVDAAVLLGVPKSVAIIYGIVFASPQPLSFSDIEHRLSLSKGSISQGLRLLREVGAIKEVSTAVDRAELFTPDMEMRRLIERFLEHRLQKQLDAGKDRLKALQQGLPDLAKPDADTLRDRLKQLQQWHEKARSVLPVARTLLKLAPG